MTCAVMGLSITALAACQQEGNGADVYFANANLVSTDFEGVGVDWGVYEDTNKLAVGSWEKTITAVNRLSPSLVRCMTNLDWLVTNFDDKGTPDVTDDTWEYNFANKYMKNTCEILDYCQDNGIKVAFGVWNVIGNVNEELDVWKMIPNSTSDARWAVLCADLMEYLVKDKGYTCIKWFVNTNEPNYVGNKGASKNAYNTYAKWEQGVKNVSSALAGRGLGYIKVVGGDVTNSGTGFSEYLMGVAKNMPDLCANYGIHLYTSNYPIDKGTLYEELVTNYGAIRAVDNKAGKEHEVMIWESGLLDGKNVTTDCNSYIANYSYGIRMADFTVQSVLAGVNGVCYWDLDDAMHFMYTESGTTAKEWGMFSTLASASPQKQELRPWFHSSTLISNLLTSGCSIYSADTEADDGFRTVAAISADKRSGGIIAVNRGLNERTKTFSIEQKLEAGEKLYVYIFNEKNLKLGSDGYVVPNAVLSGTLNDKITLTLPVESVTVVSTKKL